MRVMNNICYTSDCIIICCLYNSYGLRTPLDPKVVSPIIDGIQNKMHDVKEALTVGVAGGSGSGTNVHM